MKSSFILFHGENVNSNQNSICHLIIIPVENGVMQNHYEFFINPEAPYQMVMSGISESQIELYPKYSESWPTIQEIFSKYSVAICSADGNTARSLFSTLSRLGIDFNPITYCNAKSLCRRSFDEISYNFDYLNFKFFNDYISFDEPIKIATRWCELALLALKNAKEDSIVDFLNNNRIVIGNISKDGITLSKCKRDYTNKNFDSSVIEVNANPDHPLFGMNVVFTGKMESMPRNDARTAVIKLGGLAPDRLTQDTDYLVVGVQDLRVVGEKGLSGKMKTAAKYREKGLSIEVIDETDFLELLNS